MRMPSKVAANLAFGTKKCRSWISDRMYRPPAGIHDGAQAVELPFTAPPPIWSYSHHAITSGIASATGRPPHLYANYYINLRGPRELQAGSEGGYTLLNFEPSITIGDLGRSRMMEWKSVGPDLPQPLLLTLIEVMKERCYIIAIVDKYFIPGTVSYLKSPAPHWMVLFQHAPGSGVFAGAGYSRNGSFNRFTLSYAELERALRSDAVDRFVRRSGAARLQYARFIDDSAIALQPRGIAAQLEDFLSSQDRVTSYPPTLRSRETPPPTVVYGLRTYDVLRENLGRAARGEARVDLRATRAILEHKELMLLRIKALGAAGMLRNPEQLLGPCRQAKVAAAELHTRAMTSLSFHEAAALSEPNADRLVQTMVERERRFIPAMIAELSC